MNKKDEKKILITCPKVGFIPHLGMWGPIPNPIKVDYKVCVNMIIAGVKVYEVNPITKETVLLTLNNIDNDNKFSKKVEPIVNKVELTNLNTPEQPTVDTEAIKRAEEEKAAKEAAEKAAKEAAEKAAREAEEKEKAARREAAKQEAEKIKNDNKNNNKNTNESNNK